MMSCPLRITVRAFCYAGTQQEGLAPPPPPSVSVMRNRTLQSLLPRHVSQTTVCDTHQKSTLPVRRVRAASRVPRVTHTIIRHLTKIRRRLNRSSLMQHSPYPDRSIRQRAFQYPARPECSVAHKPLSPPRPARRRRSRAGRGLDQWCIQDRVSSLDTACAKWPKSN